MTLNLTKSHRYDIFNHMKTLIEILQPYNSIAIAGMAKNVGKTTVLNHMIGKLGGTMGLTSIGLDGEETDHVTATPKPRIFVPAGTIIATAEMLLTTRNQGINDIARQILAVMDDYTTPLGRIVVARALTPGHVMLAGPSMVQQIPPIMQILRNMGADRIIIDGALARKSLAMPDLARAVVLATGASVARSMDKVVADTKHAVEIFRLPTFDENNEYMRLDGAVTDAKLEGLFDKNIVAHDATKILISPKALAKLRLGGGTISVIKKINLAAVTINPTSPYGINFNANEFLEKMSRAVSVPVFNVNQELNL